VHFEEEAYWRLAVQVAEAIRKGEGGWDE